MIVDVEVGKKYRASDSLVLLITAIDDNEVVFERHVNDQFVASETMEICNFHSNSSILVEEPEEFKSHIDMSKEEILAELDAGLQYYNRNACVSAIQRLVEIIKEESK